MNRSVAFLRSLVRGALVGGVCLGLGGPVLADMAATTEDGRRVLLSDDGTWSFVDEPSADGAEGGETPPRIWITLENTKDLPNECRVGLRLVNQAPYEIRSLVPQFSAYNRQDVRFVTVFEDFLRIKPQRDQYQEVAFRGIACDDIGRIEVHGGDRCSMDDLNKFSRVKGECLKRVGVRSQGPIPMGK